MKISFTPQRGPTPMTLAVSNDILTIDGEAFDFSGIPDGATVPRDAVSCGSLVSDIERIDGEICLTLILPHGAKAPIETRFPEPIIATAGEVTLPLFDAPEEALEG